MVTVNTHVHTPYSFSSFDSVRQAVELAAREDVRVLGVSDFNTVAAYEEFGDACAELGVYPLYNIEFISLLENDRDAGRRWNDPANPGVMYVCGKALAHPSTLSDDARARLKCLWKGTQDHIWQVINKLNDYLGERTVPITLDYGTIRSTYAKGTVRERHVARALTDALRGRYPSDDEFRGLVRSLWDDFSAVVDVTDDIGLQNQMRARLLKAGKPAFVEEEGSAFFSLDDVRGIILDGGGIPCYPVLADESRELGEYESDPEALANKLRELRFYAVEFIPTRNGFDHLKRYAKVLRGHGMCVTFGTEHNTPGMSTMVPQARGGEAFDDELSELAYEGACILAAHQKQRAEGDSGYVNRRGSRVVEPDDLAEFARIGDEAIKAALGTS